MRKITLNKSRGKRSVNTDSGLNVGLVGGRKQLPSTDAQVNVSAYEQYVQERSACNKIRLTCQVNPICSNVLHNAVTEVVKNEGSDSLCFINYGVGSDGDFSDVAYKPKTKAFWSELEAMRDTQLSNFDFDYHCGDDIFNNHLLRTDAFKVVCPITEANGSSVPVSSTNYPLFNTFQDSLRNFSGSQVTDTVTFPINVQVQDNPKIVNLHLYTKDEFDDFDDAIEKRLIMRSDGWFGFYNPNKMESHIFSKTAGKKNEIEGTLPVGKVIMSANGGDFIDMYPSRDLYSFVPKYNVHRRRIEKNWNYCLTYPSKSTTFGFEDIIDAKGGLKALYYDENTMSDNGTKQIVVYGISKHGLSEGDYVNLYMTNGDETTLVLEGAKVAAIADDYIFTVFADVQLSNMWIDVTETTSVTVDNVTYTVSDDDDKFISADGNIVRYVVNNQYVNFDSTAQNLSYKKVVNGVECSYYVRIFSRIPNFKRYSGSTNNEYEIYKDGGKAISDCQDVAHEFENHLSRLAFAKNIYGDNIGQVVFTDDIDLSNLKDNLGRPLSSIYLTVIKNNKGYKEWYGSNINNWRTELVNDENVEFSHCFGQVSCAFDLSEESVVDESLKSIKTLNLVDGTNRGVDVSYINGVRTYGDVEISNDEVWYESDKHFYGDLVCYDAYNALETQIQPILHRFNTAQRESSIMDSKAYFERYSYDNLKYDDYDSNEYATETKYKNQANEKKEGYYYMPHNEIVVKRFGELRSASPDYLSMRSLYNVGGGIVRVSTKLNHFLTIGDKAVIYDKTTDTPYTLVVVGHEGSNEKLFYAKVYNEKGDEADEGIIPDIVQSSEYYGEYVLTKADNLDIPSYACMLKDGTCRYVWRDLEDDPNAENAYPFTNGAIYINRRVDLYVRRQDPHGIYGLYSESDKIGDEISVEFENNYVKEEDIEC